MIVNVLIGGPHDGRTVVTNDITPLVCVVQSVPIGIGPEQPSPIQTPEAVTYIPDRESYRACTCVPDCPHGTVTLYVAGYRR